MDSINKTGENHSNSAIILAYGNHATGLGLIRALGKRGIDTFLVDKDKWNLGKYSKHCKKFFKLEKELFYSEKDFLDFLKDIKNKENLNRPIIFPANDYHVKILSRNKEKLEKDFFVATPPWEITKKCYDKVLTYKLAKKIDIPIPKTFFARDEIDLKKIDDEMEYPIIIKPGVMHEFLKKTGKKVFIANNFEELENKYSKASSVVEPGNLMIQDIIPGGPEYLYSYGSLFTNAEEIEYIVGQRKRQIPMDFGVGSTFVKQMKKEKVRELGKKILEHIDYYGISEVEFKKDPRDGKYKLLEINPRAWKWHSILLGLDLNFPYMVYSDIIGKQIKNNNKKGSNIKWVDIYQDSYISFKEILIGKLNLKDYLRSIQGEKTFSVFHKKDIKPFLFETLLLPYLYLKRK